MCYFLSKPVFLGHMRISPVFFKDFKGTENSFINFLLNNGMAKMGFWYSNSEEWRLFSQMERFVSKEDCRKRMIVKSWTRWQSSFQIWDFGSRNVSLSSYELGTHKDRLNWLFFSICFCQSGLERQIFFSS